MNSNYTQVRQSNNFYAISSKENKKQMIVDFHKNHSTSSKMIVDLVEKISKISYIPMPDEPINTHDNFLWSVKNRQLRVGIWSGECDTGKLAWRDEKTPDFEWYIVDDVDFIVERLKEMYKPAMPKKVVAVIHA